MVRSCPIIPKLSRFIVVRGQKPRFESSISLGGVQKFDRLVWTQSVSENLDVINIYSEIIKIIHRCNPLFVYETLKSINFHYKYLAAKRFAGSFNPDLPSLQSEKKCLSLVGSLQIIW